MFIRILKGYEETRTRRQDKLEYCVVMKVTILIAPKYIVAGKFLDGII